MAKTSGARNRRAGHTFELVTAKQLRKVFPHIASTRSCNRARDNQGVDLCNQDEYLHGRIPYNIQCKSVSKGLNYLALMKEMPKEPGIINVVLHRYTEKKETAAGAKFHMQGEFAITRMVDFIEMVKASETLKAIIQHIDKLPKDVAKQVDEHLAAILTHHTDDI